MAWHQAVNNFCAMARDRASAWPGCPMVSIWWKAITHSLWSVISAEAPHSGLNGSLLLTKGRNICRESNDPVTAAPSFLGNFLVSGPLEEPDARSFYALISCFMASAGPLQGLVYPEQSDQEGSCTIGRNLYISHPLFFLPPCLPLVPPLFLKQSLSVYYHYHRK